MILRITAAEYLGEHRLRLTFNDGTSGEGDFRSLLVGPIYEPLHDAERFAAFTLDKQRGVLEWGGEIDIAPEALRECCLELSTSNELAH